MINRHNKLEKEEGFDILKHANRNEFWFLHRQP